LILGGTAGILLLFTELDLIKIQYRNYPTYIKAHSDYLRHPESKEALREKEIEYYRVILPEDEFKRYKEETKEQK
jgi:hypothetical protein